MTTDVLDSTVPTRFNHGWFFPLTTRIMGYTLLAFGFLFLVSQWYIGFAIILLGAFISFSFSGVDIDVSNKEVTDYNKYIGFIKTSKKYSYTKLHYITVMPKRISKTTNANLVQNSVETEYKFTITLFTENFRSKKELVIYKSKSEAEFIAKQLGGLLQLSYFEYDPQFVRERLSQR